MTSLYGTSTEYTDSEMYFPTYPDTNFEYWNNPEQVKGCDNRKRTKEIEHQLETKAEKKIKDTGARELTILDCLNTDPRISLFASLIKRNPVYEGLLNEEKLTLFAPRNCYFEEMKLNGLIKMQKDYGPKYAGMKIRQLISSYIVDVIVYPEQLRKRKVRIDTMSKTNTIILDDFVIKSQSNLLAPESNGLPTLQGSKSPLPWNRVEYAIMCKNGVIYVCTRPFCPLNFFGVNSVIA